MTFMVTFKVEGAPQGKGRPKFSRQGGFVRAYTPKATIDYENLIKASAMLAMGASVPLETPVEVYLYVTKAIPASYSKKKRMECLEQIHQPITKPDIDNILKAYLDAMNEVVYKDDKQVVTIHATQVYGTDPMVEVLVRENLQ